MGLLSELRYTLFGPPTNGRCPAWIIEENDPICGPALRSTEDWARRLDPEYRAQAEEEDRRRAWFRDRMWHNGPHANCCKKCFQAGFVVAAALCEQPDLIQKYPELIGVFEELSRDGMMDTAFAATRGYRRERR